MGEERVADRLVAAELQIDSQNLAQARLTESELKTLQENQERISQWDLIIDDDPALTPEKMRSKLALYHAQKPVDLVLVDYLQLMESHGHRSRVEEVSHISRSLKKMSREFAPILAGAQLSRAVEQRKDKRPMLADLRESGSLEQDADIVTFIHKPEGKHDPKTDLLVEKHRNGPLGSIQLIYQKAYTRFVTPTAKSLPLDYVT
jgi:replicative DNA helicase